MSNITQRDELREAAGWVPIPTGFRSDPRSLAVWELQLAKVWNKALGVAAHIVHPLDPEDEERECSEVAKEIRAQERHYHSEDVERLFTRREELEGTDPRTEGEEAELDGLREKIWELPTASDPDSQAAMDHVKRAAALLRKHEPKVMIPAADEEPLRAFLDSALAVLGGFSDSEGRPTGETILGHPIVDDELGPSTPEEEEQLAAAQRLLEALGGAP